MQHIERPIALNPVRNCIRPAVGKISNGMKNEYLPIKATIEEIIDE